VRVPPLFIALGAVLAIAAALGEGWPGWVPYVLGALGVVAMVCACKPESTPHERALRAIQSDEDCEVLRRMNPAPYQRPDGRAS
jgi:hypothetical protein